MPSTSILHRSMPGLPVSWLGFGTICFKTLKTFLRIGGVRYMCCSPMSSLGISSRDLRSNSMSAMSFFQNSICKSMTFRIDCFHEDFSGLTRCQLSTVPVERRFLLLIQIDIYRQRVKNASQTCIKPKNLRFSFLRICQQLQCVLDSRSNTS